VQIPNDRAKFTEAELIVFQYEFKAGVNAYLAALAPGAPVHTLADIIAFNKRNPVTNLPFFSEE
jgi:amidase